MNEIGEVRYYEIVCLKKTAADLDETGSGWNLSIEVFLSLLLLNFEGKSGSKDTLKVNSDSVFQTFDTFWLTRIRMNGIFDMLLMIDIKLNNHDIVESQIEMQL